MKKISLLILVFTAWLPGTLAAAQPSPDKIRSYEKHALSHAGDSQRGKQLFSDQRTRCNICHTIENEGGDVVPDLSTIGGKFDRPHLIESLLHPSQQIVGIGEQTAGLPDNELARRCRKLLEESIVDFYLPDCVDSRHGGYLEVLDDEGKFSGQSEKFLTLQARQLWFFSRLANHNIRRDEALEAARSGYEFIRDHFHDQKLGGYFTKVSQQGSPTDDRKHVYPNAFVIYALVEYHRATGDPKPLEDALGLFRTLDQRCYDSKNGGYHEFFFSDWKPVTGEGHSGYIGAIGTKTYNSHLHLLEAFTELYRSTSDPLVANRLRELIEICTVKVRHPEFPCNVDGWKPDWTMIDTDSNRRTSYGHDVECSWLVLDAADALGIRTAELNDWAKTIGGFAIRWGYDKKHAGFFYTGPINRPSDDRKKEWWTQSEALVAMLTLEQITGDNTYRNLFEATLGFIERHQIADSGGWWASVNEDGSPKNPKSKTSMWQGAYHNGRALILCEKMLRESED